MQHQARPPAVCARYLDVWFAVFLFPVVEELCAQVTPRVPVNAKMAIYCLAFLCSVLVLRPTNLNQLLPRQGWVARKGSQLPDGYLVLAKPVAH